MHLHCPHSLCPPSTPSNAHSLHPSTYARVLQLFRGMYAVFLERWFQVFPKSSFLVIRAEDMFKDQRATIERIYRCGSYASLLGVQERFSCALHLSYTYTHTSESERC